MVKTITRKAISTLTDLCLQHLDNVVLDYIRKNPGKRCYQIDAETLKSHHNWGTKYILERLENSGQIVKQSFDLEQQGDEWVTVKIAPRYFSY